MSRRTFFFGLLIAALLIFSLYRAKYGARDTAADLMEVDARIEAATKEKVMLETELAHMSRRDSIEEYARKKLGMAPPKADQMADEADLDVLVGPPTDDLSPAVTAEDSASAEAPAEAAP